MLGTYTPGLDSRAKISKVKVSARQDIWGLTLRSEFGLITCRPVCDVVYSAVDNGNVVVLISGTFVHGK